MTSTESENTAFLIPEWPAPQGIRAVSTTRLGGVSKAPWASLNLATHVQDDPQAVAENRRRLVDALGLAAQPQWLQQVHGCEVHRPEQGGEVDSCQADAAFSDQAAQVCVVMTADCLPVLFCDESGRRVAAAHAGWRGLADGVLESTLRHFPDPAAVMAWLGPAIGPQAFEVGDEVREIFCRRDAAAESAFTANRPGHWLADIYRLARLRLASAGVSRVSGGDYCTFSDSERFFSFRRDGVTGRMASLIWIDPGQG